MNIERRISIPMDRTIERIPAPFRSDLSSTHADEFHDKVKDYAQSLKSTKLSATDIRMSKVIIMGDMGVGKTSLVNRFVNNSFNKDYKATIGVDFEVERFKILGLPFNLQIWDTAGQERFKCIAAGSNAIIVTFDMTDRETLFHAEHWLYDALGVTNNKNDPLIFLVGTKYDLLDKTKINEIELLAEQYAKRLNAEYWPISSLTGENVRRFFFRLSSLLFNKSVLDENKIESHKKKLGGDDIVLNSGIKNTNNEKNNDLKCC